MISTEVHPSDSTKDNREPERRMLAATLLPAAMVVYHYLYTGSRNFLPLLWNLALACLPLAIAIVCRDWGRVGERRWRVVAVIVLWALFYPNAPYLVTDLIHIPWETGSTLLDQLVPFAAAWHGVMLGAISTTIIARVAERRWGERGGWLLVCGVAVLGTWGIMLGRRHRWNSWDVASDPGGVIADLVQVVVHTFSHFHDLLLFLFFLLFQIMVVWMLSSLMRDRPSR